MRPFTPSHFQLAEDEMRRLGSSRQKARHTRLLAEAIKRRQFDLRGLHDLPDHRAREKRMARKGIGPWTADICLPSALRRPDIGPVETSRALDRRA